MSSLYLPVTPCTLALADMIVYICPTLKLMKHLALFLKTISSANTHLLTGIVGDIFPLTKLMRCLTPFLNQAAIVEFGQPNLLASALSVPMGGAETRRGIRISSIVS